MHRPTWPNTLWRGDLLWYQRRAPRDCIAAFRDPAKSIAEDPVRVSFGVSLSDALSDWARVDRLVKHTDERFERWVSLARQGSLNWPQAKLEDDVRRMDEFLAKRLERHFPDRRIVVTETDRSMLESFQRSLAQSPVEIFGPLGFTVVEEVEHPVAAPLIARAGLREVRLEKDANQPCSILVETYIREMRPGKRETEIRLAVKRFVNAVGDKAQKDVDEFDVSKFYKFLDTVKNDRGGHEFIGVETQKKTKAQANSRCSI